MYCNQATTGKRSSLHDCIHFIYHNLTEEPPIKDTLYKDTTVQPRLSEPRLSVLSIIRTLHTNKIMRSKYNKVHVAAHAHMLLVRMQPPRLVYEYSFVYFSTTLKLVHVRWLLENVSESFYRSRIKSICWINPYRTA